MESWQDWDRSLGSGRRCLYPAQVLDPSHIPGQLVAVRTAQISATKINDADPSRPIGAHGGVRGMFPLAQTCTGCSTHMPAYSSSTS